jgi:glutathione S-transferase
VKLYLKPGACSLAPHIALNESGLKYDTAQVDLATKKLADGGDFLAVNPKGQVPTLQLDDGGILTENAVILQYIADKAPGANLLPPAGSLERYRVQEWLNFVATELHKGFSPLFRPNTPEDYKPVARENLAAKFGYLDRQLANRQFLAGDRFTVADCYCFVMGTWAKRVGIDLAKWPNVAAYMARVGDRAAVRETLKAEGLS